MKAGDFGPKRRAASGRSTIFIDLDDTLVDTFHLLIVPLERAASAAICRTGTFAFTDEQLTATLLSLRRKNPAALRDKLTILLDSKAEQGLAIRDRIFADFSVDALTIDRDVIETLETLSRDYRLVLVTEGRRHLQERKISHLGIGRLFHERLIVDAGGDSDAKESAMRNYMLNKDISSREAMIVGNRLDRDIIAGQNLEMRTIWLQSGEGSEMVPEQLGAIPDACVGSVAELPAAIRKIRDRMARQGREP
jgi:FMN phosphatase YigB (HAD superfamily)